ncbi:MAG: thioredoxin domain-containing protein [bacterium]|nr:thioredoxin domain-containing protein [bacterium]
MEPNMNSQTGSQNAEVSGKRRDYLMPASILIAAVLVSAALVYNAEKKPAVGEPPAGFPPSAVTTGTPDKMPPVTADDHVLGDLASASVVVVEYSDLECPFCKRFHATMQQAVTAYGGKVAWVYRHWPILSRHPLAQKEAEASECAADIGGNDAFWKYVARVFEVSPTNNGLDPAELPEIAVAVGLDRAAFTTCLASGKYEARVTAQANDAIAAGGNGTPYSVVVTKTGKFFTIPGALPFTDTDPTPQSSVKEILDEALK